MHATTDALARIALTRELAQRSRIRAFRAGRHLLIVAEGDLPNPAFEVDIRQNPIRIFPPQFDLLWRQRPDIVPQVVVPYRHAEVVPFPAEPPTVIVHHADGQDEVRVEECGTELAGYAELVSDGAQPGTVEAVGSSPRLSFEEALADALAQLPPFEPPFPDAVDRVTVAGAELLFGGVAGFRHLFVRVRRVPG